MALSETDTSDCNSDSSADGGKHSDRRDRLFTKIVVRRLPPSMTKDTFLNQVSPLPDYDYMYFVRADMSLGEYAFSRAYINFKNPSDIFIFKEKFDNYVFLDSKGNEYAAVVEFAPFTRIPKKRNKIRVDPKCATIETDPIYLEFVELLNQVSNENEEKPEYCFQPSTEEEKKITNTPLLDFIKQRRIDRQKMKEEKREERKRRELERKKMKDDQKGRKRIDHVSHSSSSMGKLSSKTSNLDVIDENKIKDKKDEYKNRMGPKVGMKEYGEKRVFTSHKDSRMMDRKSPSKIRQRSQIVEKEARRTEYKSRRDEFSNRSRKDERDDKTVEKKVKKYSERREERKNEFKRQESKTETDDGQDMKDQEAGKSESKREDTSEEKSERNEEKNESEKFRSSSREKSKENDPRVQRRIRNKDRPTMQIYQPGMLRNKKPQDGNGNGQQNGDEPKSTTNTESNKSQ